MRVSDFDFSLPQELIAQEPLAQRDASRLLLLDRSRREVEHSQFADLRSHLRKGDLLVLNDSKVIRARLRGVNTRTDGQFELLLTEQNAPNDWWAMLKPGRRARVGTRIRLLDHSRSSTNIITEVTDTNEEGHRRLQFSGCTDILNELEQLGEMPLPPYIRRTATDADASRYQTVFAHAAGSVAAPTAGLHFTPDLISALQSNGIAFCHVTLHVGLGTFAPMKTERIESHVMHEERYEVSSAVADQISGAKAEGRRIVAIGTTALRTLESAWRDGKVQPGLNRTRLFITPPFTFNVVDALLTNFHLPKSTLLMLVSAFADPGGVTGRDTILSAYGEAIAKRYRFFSYGDAMLIQ